jgi:hypothetical protein
MLTPSVCISAWRLKSSCTTGQSRDWPGQTRDLPDFLRCLLLRSPNSSRGPLGAHRKVMEFPAARVVPPAASFSPRLASRRLARPAICIARDSLRIHGEARMRIGPRVSGSTVPESPTTLHGRINFIWASSRSPALPDRSSRAMTRAACWIPAEYYIALSHTQTGLRSDSGSGRQDSASTLLPPRAWISESCWPAVPPRSAGIPEAGPAIRESW